MARNASGKMLLISCRQLMWCPSSGLMLFDLCASDSNIPCSQCGSFLIGPSGHAETTRICASSSSPPHPQKRLLNPLIVWNCRLENSTTPPKYSA